jgi:hypothetical protein
VVDDEAVAAVEAHRLGIALLVALEPRLRAAAAEGAAHGGLASISHL